METMDEMSHGKTSYGISCHIDHQPSRTGNYNTFKTSCYDPDLANVATFTVHMEKKDDVRLSTAFAYLKEVLVWKEQVKYKNNLNWTHRYQICGQRASRLML